MTPLAYNRYSRWLHWIMAGLMLFMVFLGWSLDVHDVQRYARFQLHKSVGITVFLLSFVRIGLRLAYKAPAEPPMPGWQALAAKAVHIGFYVLMIGLPLTGWVLVSTSKHGVQTVLYGVVPWPNLPLGHEFGKPAHLLHERGAQILIYLLVPLHVIAALKHHFFDRDATLSHMLPGLEPKSSIPEALKNPRWLVPLGIGLAAFASVGFLIDRATAKKEDGDHEAATAASSVTSSQGTSESSTTASSVASLTSSSAISQAEATHWTVDTAQSSLGFTTAFQGAPVNGQFSVYDAEIVFDPEALGASQVKVKIDLGSADSGDSERDETLKGPSFFDTTKFPKAVFEAHRFTKVSEGHFVAHGRLSLHGVSKPALLPFTLKLSGKGKDRVAVAEGQLSLKRLDFGVGSGEWAAIDQVPDAVAIHIKVKAKG